MSFGLTFAAISTATGFTQLFRRTFLKKFDCDSDSAMFALGSDRLQSFSTGLAQPVNGRNVHDVLAKGPADQAGELTLEAVHIIMSIFCIGDLIRRVGKIAAKGKRGKKRELEREKNGEGGIERGEGGRNLEVESWRNEMGRRRRLRSYYVYRNRK
jgi:hypothetical protein